MHNRMLKICTLSTEDVAGVELLPVGPTGAAQGPAIAVPDVVGGRADAAAGDAAARHGERGGDDGEALSCTASSPSRHFSLAAGASSPHFLASYFWVLKLRRRSKGEGFLHLCSVGVAGWSGWLAGCLGAWEHSAINVVGRRRARAVWQEAAAYGFDAVA
jgi:hypothetical protein